MKTIHPLSAGLNHTAVDLGIFDELMQYSLIHPVNKREIEGKVFLKDATDATGTEISFNIIPPRQEVPYFHVHNKNEETYIILRGNGFYQVDEDCFPIQEGSVIRVAPAGNRGLCNTSEEPMIYIAIQSKEHSLEEHTTADGTRLPAEPKWR
jgi:mannose-6-phosphate isomerase-like protein (cupin superfamily)